jgi:Ca2+/H+ antiporter, TMEM165/GDT1 family
MVKMNTTWEDFMDPKILFTTFGTIFLAELGDKTQLATLAFASESPSRLAVFIGSAGALILTSFLGVVFGSLAYKWIPPQMIRIGAGSLFIILGLWMLIFSGNK